MAADYLRRITAYAKFSNNIRIWHTARDAEGFQRFDHGFWQGIVFKKLKVLIDSADSIVENMDFAVGIVKLTQSDFYNGYKSIRKFFPASYQTATGSSEVFVLQFDFSCINVLG